jgi:hypothetical protein
MGRTSSQDGGKHVQWLWQWESAATSKFGRIILRVRSRLLAQDGVLAADCQLTRTKIRISGSRSLNLRPYDECLSRARCLSGPHFPLRLLTDTTKKGPSLESYNCTARQNSPYSMESDSSSRSLQNLSTSTILSQTNTKHNLPSYLCKINFNIILPSTFWSSMRSLSFRFSLHRRSSLSFVVRFLRYGNSRTQF